MKLCQLTCTEYVIKYFAVNADNWFKSRLGFCGERSIHGMKIRGKGRKRGYGYNWNIQEAVDE